MRVKIISRAKIDKFFKIVVRHLDQLAVAGKLVKLDREKEWDDYRMDTTHGPLILRLDLPRPGERCALATIFGRFEDVRRAERLGCNPYSGKCNHHYNADDFWRGPEYIAERFLNWLCALGVSLAA